MRSEFVTYMFRCGLIMLTLGIVLPLFGYAFELVWLLVPPVIALAPTGLVFIVMALILGRAS